MASRGGRANISVELALRPRAILALRVRKLLHDRSRIPLVYGKHEGGGVAGGRRYAGGGVKGVAGGCAGKGGGVMGVLGTVK